MEPNNQIPQMQQQGPAGQYQPQQQVAAPTFMPPNPPVGLPGRRPPVGLFVLLAVASLLFAGSAVLAFMFYGQMQDYKLNSDKKSAAAVKIANEAQKKELDRQFAEKYKEPLTTYTLPAQFGGVSISYPRTWSVYVDEGGGSNPVNAYFHPGFVPSDKNRSSEFNYALRAQILQSSYQKEVDAYSQLIKQGATVATPLTGLAGNSTGVRLDGKIDQNKNGSVVIIPVRDKVLKIWTEGDVYKNDFNNFIIKNLNYNP
jgi:hypothetical protein